jgi:hypothetical protein
MNGNQDYATSLKNEIYASKEDDPPLTFILNLNNSIL